MLAVIEAPIIFLFQSLFKQMFVVIAEAVPQGVLQDISQRKRNNFINNG